MKKSDFFSEQNIHLLTQQLKAVGFGLGLEPREVFQLLKPTMINLYKTTSANVSVGELNKKILIMYASQPLELKTVKVSKERTLDKAVDDYIQRRNAFDVSIGLRPTNYGVGIKNEPKVDPISYTPTVAHTVNPLDEFFQIM